MANGDNPSHADIWEAVNQSRMDISKLQGMLEMHFHDTTNHHNPPCKAAADVQKTMLSAVGAALLALLAALGALLLELFRR